MFNAYDPETLNKAELPREFRLRAAELSDAGHLLESAPGLGQYRQSKAEHPRVINPNLKPNQTSEVPSTEVPAQFNSLNSQSNVEKAQEAVKRALEAA